MHSGAVSRPEKAPPAGKVRVAAVFHRRGEVGMAGTGDHGKPRVAPRSGCGVADVAVRGVPPGDVPHEAGEKFRYIRLFSGGGPLVLTRCAAVQKALKGLHIDGLSGRQALQRHADGRRVGLAENRQVQVLTVLAHRAPPFRAEKSFQKSG